MFRDRTNLYISYRQTYSRHPLHSSSSRRRHRHDRFLFDGDDPSQSEEHRGLIAQDGDAYSDDGFADAGAGAAARGGSVGDAVIEMDVLPPRWIDVQQEVNDQLDDIARRSAQLARLHQKHLLPGFGDEEPRRRDELEIERLTQEITQGFRRCQAAIAGIERMVKTAKAAAAAAASAAESGRGAAQGGAAAGGMTRTEETMAKNVQISLAARVQEASTKFRKSQSSYLKKLRDIEGLPSPTASFSPGRPSPSVNEAAQNPYLDPSLMDSEVDKSYSQDTLSQLQTHQQRHAPVATGIHDAAIAQREREINDIAKGIIELSDIFKDLQTMIIDQGTMLDRIDYNVEKMTTEVKGAEQELRVATNYQRRTTKRKILLLLVIIVVGLFILLLVKPKRHDSAPSSSSSPPPTPRLLSPRSDISPGRRRSLHKLDCWWCRRRWRRQDAVVASVGPPPGLGHSKYPVHRPGGISR